jgi:hypothetical protein
VGSCRWRAAGTLGRGAGGLPATTLRHCRSGGWLHHNRPASPAQPSPAQPSPAQPLPFQKFVHLELAAPALRCAPRRPCSAQHLVGGGGGGDSAALCACALKAAGPRAGRGLEPRPSATASGTEQRRHRRCCRPPARSCEHCSLDELLLRWELRLFRLSTRALQAGNKVGAAATAVAAGVLAKALWVNAEGPRQRRVQRPCQQPWCPGPPPWRRSARCCA